MIYALIGPQKSGKTYLAEKLKTKNLTIATSDKIENINEIKNSDIVMSDPEQIENIANAIPEKAFCLVRIKTDATMRKLFAMKSLEKEKKKEYEKAYDKTESEDNPMYAAFGDAIEAYRQNLNTFPKNIISILDYPNDYSDSTAESYSEMLASHIKTCKKLNKIVDEAIKLKIFNTDPNDPDKIEISTETETIFVNTEIITGKLATNPTEFWQFMMAYIAVSERFKDL